MRGSHETPDGQVESRRAKLPLVITIGRKVGDLMVFPGTLQDVHDHAIDLGVPSAAFLIRGLARVPQTGGHQTMLDPRHPTFVQCQPGNGTNGAGHEEKPVGIAPRPWLQVFR